MHQRLEILKKAIQHKQVIHFYYENYLREVEPHHYGILGDDIQLHAYQTKGKSHSGELPQWRNFKVCEMQYISLEQTTFKIRKSYNPFNAHYTCILKSVDFNQFS